MILPIKLYGSPILRSKSTSIVPEEITSQLINNMFETLSQQKGIGLAAPQVGQLQRVFIIDTLAMDNADAKIHKGYINPEILDYGDETSYYIEGCLSIPGIMEETLRPDKIWVKYLDEEFNEQRKELSGIQARVFQHEYDHLEGVLFTDRLSAIKKKLIRSKLNQIRKSVALRE